MANARQLPRSIHAKVKYYLRMQNDITSQNRNNESNHIITSLSKCVGGSKEKNRNSQKANNLLVVRQRIQNRAGYYNYECEVPKGSLVVCRLEFPSDLLPSRSWSFEAADFDGDALCVVGVNWEGSETGAPPPGFIVAVLFDVLVMYLTFGWLFPRSTWTGDIQLRRNRCQQL